MIGKHISHYHILEKLGEGGMGVVYKAQDTRLDRTVAIKFLPRHVAVNAEEKQRFVVEAKAAAALNHPNIATIYAIEEADDEMFIVMEYIDGQELKNIIGAYQDTPQLPIDRLIQYAIQIAEGLQAAHEKGIIHRDIKSSNIMITNGGNVKIMDFGLAKVRGASNLTQVGSTVGTIAYMSPEQARGEDVDQRSDIFSFGVVLYEMLTTHHPFREEYQEALIYSLLNEDPQPISRYNNKVSQELGRIVFKALQKERRERYQHIDDMLTDLKLERKNLEHIRSGHVKTPDSELPVSVESGPAKRTLHHKEPHKRSVLRVIILSAIIILFAAVFFVFNPYQPHRRQNSGSSAGSNSLAVMYFQNVPNPTDKNHTGDMLTRLLITSLSQIKGLYVVSHERLLEIEKEMGRTNVTGLSPSDAIQIARRAGVTIILTGSILQLQPKLAVSTNLINVRTGQVIGSQQLTNFSESQIFKLVDSLSVLIQDNLHVAPAATQGIKSVAEVTTQSPEAYRAFVTGRELQNNVYFKEAIAAFSRATELDKNFAMAYYYLAEIQSYVGLMEASEKSLKKAVELADRTTARERLQILTYNYLQHNDIPKAIEGYKQLIAKYPHEINNYLLLGFAIYTRKMLEFKKAGRLYRSGLEVEPTSTILLNLLAYNLAWENKRQEALDAANKDISLEPAEPNAYDTKGDIYSLFEEYDSSFNCYQKSVSLRRDFSSANKVGFYQLLKGKHGETKKYFDLTGLQLPLIAMHRGQLKDAERKLQDMLNTEISYNTRITALRTLTQLCYETGDYGDMLKYSEKLSSDLKKNPPEEEYALDLTAWALVKNGKSSEAEIYLKNKQKDINSKYPSYRTNVDFRSAVVLFEQGKVKSALKKFNQVYAKLPPNHEPNIFYARCLLKNGKIDTAMKELKRILYWPRIFDIWILPYVPAGWAAWPVPAVKAHYWLGVAYQNLGENEEALFQYQEFLDIWKNVDFNSPEMADAKVRVVKLEAIARR